jgi:cytochrome c oxidase cbb3-type subunit 3
MDEITKPEIKIIKDDHENAPLLEHNYDGIQEYDNPLPLWWLCTFIGTVIFAFIYYIHYEVAGGPTLQDELKVSMEEIAVIAAGNHFDRKLESEVELIEKMKSPENLISGKGVFEGKCVACHGEKGQGIIGPNLTDHFWIHGKGQRTDIIAVIRNGVNDKGMPAWQTMLKADEIISVAAYVYSLRGTNPTQAKAPQGEEVK